MLYSAAQLTYLEHLGIDVWVPKVMSIETAAPEAGQSLVEQVQTAPIESAVESYSAPSHFEDVPVVPVNRPQQVAPVHVATSPIQMPPVKTQVPSSALNSALTSGIPAPAFPQQAPIADSSVVSRVEFNVQFWCYSSGVWLIGGDVNVTPEQHKLVHNLAQFIQGKKRRPRHVNVFSWPMIDSPNVDQGEGIAAKYLLAHIERLQQACEQKTVIVFNDCDYFPSQIPHIKLGVSLQQLLNDPAAKKALWQQLLPLKFQD
jgi:hypothetical protein